MCTSRPAPTTYAATPTYRVHRDTLLQHTLRRMVDPGGFLTWSHGRDLHSMLKFSDGDARRFGFSDTPVGVGTATRLGTSDLYYGI